MLYSGVLQWIVKYCLGTPKTYSKALIRLMLPVSMMSSVLSNTTVVALFLKAVQMWAKRLNIAPSKLLIPLSYASGLGGILTLIGSPTNLVIAGFYADDTGQSLGLFTPTVVGLLCLAVGILSMLALSRLLPVRKSQEDALENVSDYTVELMVPTECPHVGKTVEEAGLYNVEGGHIIEIIRFDHEIISPVSKDEFIFGGDRLIFSGDVARILELKKTHQLVNATHHVFSLKEVEGNRRLQMANVKFTSSLVGKRMRDTDFEESNDVVVVAVAREGERIQDSPREVVLEKGDTLLLECSPSFLKRQEGYASDLQLFDSEKVPNIGSKTGYNTRRWTKHGKLPYVDYTGASTGGGSQGTTQPSKPSEGTVGACVGDTVTFTGNKHYVSSNALNGSACKPGKAKVTAMAGNAKHPYHLIKVPGGGSTVYGWVDAADIQVEGGITVGSKVKVNKGAKTYTGGGLASFVYTNTYTVIQVDGDRVVIGQNGVVTAAVNSKDLTLVG